MIVSALLVTVKIGGPFILGYIGIRWNRAGWRSPFTLQQFIEEIGAYLLFFFFAGAGFYAYSIEKTYINLTVIKCVTFCVFVGLLFNILLQRVIWPELNIPFTRLISGPLTVALLGVYAGIIIGEMWPKYKYIVKR
jgi:hypothetical protein